MNFLKSPFTDLNFIVLPECCFSNSPGNPDQRAAGLKSVSRNNRLHFGGVTCITHSTGFGIMYTFLLQNCGHSCLPMRTRNLLVCSSREPSERKLSAGKLSCNLHRSGAQLGRSHVKVSFERRSSSRPIKYVRNVGKYISK